jgi:hypothetical protein
MTVIQMSERELTRLRVLIDLLDKRLTVDNGGMWPGSGHRTILMRPDCHRRAGRHALPWQRQPPDCFRLTAQHFECAGRERRPQGLRCAHRQAGSGP